MGFLRQIVFVFLVMLRFSKKKGFMVDVKAKYMLLLEIRMLDVELELRRQLCESGDSKGYFEVLMPALHPHPLPTKAFG